MQFIKTWALVICSTLAISVTANAEVGKYPNVTLVAVNEINRDWVKIGLLGSGSEGHYFDGERHPNQAHMLTAFACNLYNRTAVLLSLFGRPLTHSIKGNPIEGPYLLLKDSYYLYACALAYE